MKILMDCKDSTGSNPEIPYQLLLKALLLIPISHYILLVLFLLIVFLYNFLEIHILQDLFTGFRGQNVHLLFNSTSDVYQQVVSKCNILHGRYLSTPWLCSPHLQTVFLSFLGKAPTFSYKRQIFLTSDGGTIALDWLMSINVMEPTIRLQDEGHGVNRDPIMIVIPGLTSDSESAYVKHLAFEAAQNGWNVVVSNHRGLGGVSVTSDCFYNAGWTEDIRKVVDHIHNRFSEAPLLLVGTSIGANVLVKYLGEDGANVPIVGAAAICSPWDLLICDRFINRRRVQRFYDQALAFGLKGYAQMHQSILSRLVDWDGITKSCSVRDFDNYATRVLGKYETVDTYYRRNTSATYVGTVKVPLLCISALDDPVCTREAIPWDECRANKNVVLVTTQHGGHLAYFEGLAAKNIWWVKAVNEFFSVLLTSPLIHKKKEVLPFSCSLPCTPLMSMFRGLCVSPYVQLQVSSSPMNPLVESTIDQGPYINLVDDGMVAPSVKNVETEVIDTRETEADRDEATDGDAIASTKMNDQPFLEKTKLAEERDVRPEQHLSNIIAPIKKRVDQLSRQSSKQMWLLVYVALVTTWPVVGSSLLFFFKKKLRNRFSTTFPKR